MKPATPGRRGGQGVASSEAAVFELAAAIALLYFTFHKLHYKSAPCLCALNILLQAVRILPAVFAAIAHHTQEVAVD
jgi:hypothetical protein